MRRTLALFTAVAVAVLGAGCGDDEPIRETTETTETIETTEADGSTTTEGDTAPPDEVASADLDAVEVTGEAGEQPTLTFDQPFAVDETTTRVLTEGDGLAIAPTLQATFDFVFVNGRDGSVLGTSYEAEPASLVFDDTLLAGIYKGLDGATVGSRVLVGIAPADGPGADPTVGVLDTDSLLFYVEVIDVQEAP